MTRYHELWKKFEISHDDFIRTTEPRHRAGVEALIARIEKAGDLYTAKHEGWYCSSCEAFYTEKELDAEKRCPVHGRPTVWESEENVFFRLSKYAAPLLAHYERDPGFVRPETRRAEVVSFVRGGLNDLSVSRSKVKWGIPFPGHPGHVVYVWLDALANYITALGFGSGDDRLYREFWDHPEGRRVHFIGKDILRFHAVYWPAFLLSAGLRCRRRSGRTAGGCATRRRCPSPSATSCAPTAFVADFGPDALRYFLLREMAFGQDAHFSDEAFLARYNADLANDLGNTVSRVAALCRQSFGGTPPRPATTTTIQTAWRAGGAERRAGDGRARVPPRARGGLEVPGRDQRLRRRAASPGRSARRKGLRPASRGSSMPRPRACACRPCSSRRSCRAPRGGSSRRSAFPPPTRADDLRWGACRSARYARSPRRSSRARTPPLISSRRDR